MGTRGKFGKVILGAALLSIATIGGLAYAKIPSSTNGGTVTACVANLTGIPRIIDTDANQVCLATETKVSWGSGWHAKGEYVAPTTYAQGDVVRVTKQIDYSGLVVPQPCS